MGIASAAPLALQSDKTSDESVHSQALRQDGLDREFLLQVFSALSRVSQCTTLDEGCYELAIRLKELTGSTDVAIGTCQRGTTGCRIQALAGTHRFDPAAERVQVLQSALNESIVRDQISIWPVDDDRARACLEAHHRAASISQAERMQSLPLKDSVGTIHGALLFLNPARLSDNGISLTALTAAGERIASIIGLLHKAEGSRLSRFVQKFKASYVTHKSRYWLYGLGLLTAIGLLPWTHKVSCECVVQPTTRRFVAAPFEAPLQKCLVDAGEIVHRGDLLAELEGRELRWELNALEAEYQAAAKRRDSQIADQSRAAARLSRFEVEKLEIKQKVLQQRLQQLEIRSPIDGVVISGDLERAEGIQLTVGQTLFEIAPLEKMVLELRIPESDISYAKVGMPVEAWLDSIPGTKLKGEVERIYPQSELVDHQNVFVAEIQLDNVDGKLRPGMQGGAKLSGEKRSLFWIVFHRPWEQFLLAWGW